MIEVQKIRRRYGNFLAVDQISFRIGRGEIVGLLGHNGAGKSTIMKMITGFLEPDKGRIYIAGKNLEDDPLSARQMIGYLPENCPVYPEMTVIDYLDYCACLRGLTGSQRQQAIHQTIEQTGLYEKALATIGTLSRGYRQRVGVAQALLHKPQILILDEPTNGLDPGQIEQMRELIKQLGKQATVIVSTHILQEVEATCDRVLILRRGRLALDARLAELTRSKGLLLTTDASTTELHQCLQNLPQLSQIEPLGERSSQARCYRLLPEQSHQDLAPQIAHRIITGGWKLFALQTEERTLEKIFHDITTQEVNDAAA